MAMNQIPGQNIYVGGLVTLSPTFCYHTKPAFGPSYDGPGSQRSILALKNKAALTRANITHVVSVLRLQPADDVFESFQHHCIEVDDVDDENLLEHFPAAVKFIQSGLDAGGGVLVHCAMGKSRSATVCIAYMLSRQPSALTPESALDIIRQNRPLCEPNPGFMEQLSVYHQMGCPDDVTSHPLYSRWLYRREVEESVACGRAPELKSVLFEDEQPRQSQEPAGRMTEIKCRKCRRKLATTQFIIPHTSQKNARASTADCAHVFLHPLTWMRPSLFPGTDSESSGSPYGAPPEDAPLSGRLTCPNSSCGANIGKFAWQGMQCSCGEWVVPAIGLAKARVDISERVNIIRGPGNLPAAMGIRLPPGMRSNPADESNGRGNL
ncbi:tyrosine-protein phosphatase yvh1 [Aspergillus awamori]|uniref:protein-tyrosine-phosphatase n=2 Tax=Aspergillus TaxID=5052 RepID=A0A401KX99_ASPAW|nr:tyrosine-protein phosphatase yvh1 [Aspergillus awamori]GKZ58319.1 tyrosine protein phosphatase yvh1 [Aspergillus niger]GLA01587.1 tyrosine protein phosphatase yvh1 [Aspergillus niger]GLA34679.1 tyrosine protein phosphatase yvh1 [Aspergillus niger]